MRTTFTLTSLTLPAMLMLVLVASAGCEGEPAVSPQIESGALAFGPACQLRLYADGVFTHEPLVLRQFRLRAKLTESGMAEGALSGVVPKRSIDNALIPLIAKLLDEEAHDPATPGKIARALYRIFDKNKDAKITVDEVERNSLVETLLAGDVDVDNDRLAELSLGLGFTARRAEIVTP